LHPVGRRRHSQTMHHLSNFGKGISDLIGTTKNKPEPDDLMVKCKQQLGDLHDDISIVQRQFIQYTKQVTDAAEASVTLSRSVGKFYSKADHPGRSESVNTYRKVQEDIANRAVNAFHTTVENGLVSELTEWSGLIDSLLTRIDNAETTNHTAHDTKNRLLSLQKELEEKRMKSTKKGMFGGGGNTNQNLEDLQQRISEASDAAVSLSTEYQKLRKGIAQSVKALMEKKFMYFDRIYVQMLECQTDYFAHAAATTKRFQRDIDYYRKQYPKATQTVPLSSIRHNGVGSGSGFATHSSRNSTASISPVPSHENSNTNGNINGGNANLNNQNNQNRKPNGKSNRPKVPTQRPPSYKEHQNGNERAHSHAAQSLRDELGSPTPSMSMSASPTPTQPTTPAPSKPIATQKPKEKPKAKEHSDILGMDFGSGMRKPKKAERQSSVLTRVFGGVGGDDVSTSAVLDEFGIGNICEPEDDLGLGDLGVFEDEPVRNNQPHNAFDGFDEMFTGATSNPASPLKAPAKSSLHDSVDSFSMFMSGTDTASTHSQPTEMQMTDDFGGSHKNKKQSLDDQMHSVFKAPSYQNSNSSQSAQKTNVNSSESKMNAADQKLVATMQLSQKGEARALEAQEKAMRARDAADKKAEREMAEREHWKDTHDAKLREWEFDASGSVRRNIRVLIQHLPDVLPSSLAWKPIQLSKLLNDGQLKKGYYKAVRVVHLDKSQQRGDSIETQVICDFVFQALEMAFNTKFS